jgi:hypothetical protein
MKFPRRTLCAGGLALLSTVAAAETIYRCESAGGLIYSDRPCAADAEVHTSDGTRVTVYDAPPISNHASPPRSKSSRAARPARKSAAAADAKHAATCAKLEQSLRELRAKLRTGYRVKEGERLKSRQHQLAERRRAEKCR